MRLNIILLAFGLAACGEAVRDDHFANDVQAERVEPPAANIPAVPVRIGELGPNFNACNLAGTSRHLDAAAGERLPVREGPFDTAAETGSIPAGARFFICTRSHDQRWLGVVYDEAGALSPACGVSSPISARRSYEGPCRAGWVSSAFVKQIAG